MKRNNIFMWAYIIFIFIAIGFRFSSDYSLWTPLVIAITISSILFSVEDLFISLAKLSSNLCDIQENFTPTAREMVERSLAFYEEASKKTKAFEHTEYDLSGLQSSGEHNIATLKKMIQRISDLENQATSGRKEQSKFQKIATIFAFLGFLCLFCTLIIASEITISTVAQEIFTVFSFSVILITHQINIVKSMKINDYMVNIQDIQQQQKEADEHLSLTMKQYNELIELLEDCSNAPMEELNHAH